jgi:2-polyprenyl-6-methoxyphenol hydroxylase-like FAD-dependent oxidoreductase
MLMFVNFLALDYDPSMEADVIIIGGGPAGMMAGMLFARAGIETLVLEKHGDFLRDFRGDTVHPSTMEILDQLGMLGRFLERPHDRVPQAELAIAGQIVKLGDLSALKTPAPFIAMMPQWDFLDFLKTESAAFPAFTLRMVSEVTGFVEESGRVTGVNLADGNIAHARKLVIAADGRHSLVRRSGQLPVTDLGAPMDVFWFAVPVQPGLAKGLEGIVDPGRLLVKIGRGDYWQCAFIIPKGRGDAIRAEGVAAMRARIEAIAPDLGPLEKTLTDMNQFHLLTVALDRLTVWHRPGLLAIGDAAHAMSPIGGVGINLAIQDAVAAANILAGPMVEKANVDKLLVQVQQRRLFPTRVIQAGQKFAQDRVISALFKPGMTLNRPPWPLRLLNRFPLLRRIPGRIIGLGVRRERVRSRKA